MAGVLSALGIGLADTTVMREQSVEAPLDPPTMGRVGELVDGARRRGPRRARGRGRPGRHRSASSPAVHLRYDGTDNALAVELADPDAMVTAFEAIHRRTYSFLLDRRLIVEAVSVEATGLTEQTDLTVLAEVAKGRRREARRRGGDRAAVVEREVARRAAARARAHAGRRRR